MAAAAHGAILTAAAAGELSLPPVSHHMHDDQSNHGDQHHQDEYGRQILGEPGQHNELLLLWELGIISV